MEEQNRPYYSEIHLILGITAGLAAGAIAGTLIASSLHQEKKKATLLSEDWQKYFSFMTKTAQTVLKEIPVFIDELRRPQPNAEIIHGTPKRLKD